MTNYAQAYDLMPSVAITRCNIKMGLSFISVAKTTFASMLSLKHTTRAIPPQIGYIAGTGDGIVTVRGHAAKREILLMDANSQDYRLLARVWSLDDGHYMFTDLDADKEYLMMARDYNREYEPFAYDYISPAVDLTPAEQEALWESWQT